MSLFAVQTTAAGVSFVVAGGKRWCIACVARVDSVVTDPDEQEKLYDAVPDDDGVLHAEVRKTPEKTR